MIVGIDEAGRGPVIGPLVMAGVLIEDDDKLRKLGVKDSKELTGLQRERLYDEIIKVVDKYKITIVSPQEIDDSLKSKTSNLNWLEADQSILILNELKPDLAYIDCPSNNIGQYTKYIEAKLKKKMKLVVEHGADATYAVASAASILAKVTRDREIEKIKAKIKMNFGSGYPSDPLTQGFLAKHYKDFPDIFRKTWKSYQNVVEGKQQKRLGEF
ncbi:ribonuclease HII [Candidatus Woesearchaeota archaeon]|nr:ribonuclease HII [Candidatus Woesearchaeota archaeon]